MWTLAHVLNACFTVKTAQTSNAGQIRLNTQSGQVRSGHVKGRWAGHSVTDGQVGKMGGG